MVGSRRCEKRKPQPSRTGFDGRTLRRTTPAAWRRQIQATLDREFRELRRSAQFACHATPECRQDSGSEFRLDSLGEPSEGGIMLPHDLLRRSAQTFLFHLDRLYNETFAIRRDLQLGITIDLQQLKDRLVDDQAKAISD